MGCPWIDGRLNVPPFLRGVAQCRRTVVLCPDLHGRILAEVTMKVELLSSLMDKRIVKPNEPGEPSEGQTWCRASGYEVRDGVIAPVLGAHLERYDPWGRYLEARRLEAGEAEKSMGRRPDLVPGPYVDLLRLAMELPSDFQPGQKLPKRIEARILSWCATHGLLGLLPQQTLSATLAPRWGYWHEEVPEGDAPDYELVPTVTRYVRTARGWLPMQTPFPSVFERGAYDDVEDGGLVDADLAGRLEKPGVLWDALGGSGPRQVSLSASWGRFFPWVSSVEADTYYYPRPGTEQFWREYGEPVTDFVRAARYLLDTVRSLASGQSTGMTAIEKLTSTVSPGGRITPAGRYQLTWFAPSLLAGYAMLALNDLAGPGTLRLCDHCDVPFVSLHSKYCSSKCQVAHRQTDRRRSMKKAWELHEQGLDDASIAAVLGKKPEQVPALIAAQKRKLGLS